jgi:hypothetical protein
MRANEYINRNLPFGFQPATGVAVFQDFDFPMPGCKYFSSSFSFSAVRLAIPGFKQFGKKPDRLKLRLRFKMLISFETPPGNPASQGELTR